MSLKNYAILLLAIPHLSQADIISVPSQHNTIQKAIDASNVNDTILVMPSVYQENLVLNKDITLTSNFLFSRDSNDIIQTIIDGGNVDSSAYCLRISGTTINAKIIGFTITNAEDGIFSTSKFTIQNCRIQNTHDGIDYESGSGGICSLNVFQDNIDDGIDLDSDVDIIIFGNVIRRNGDDGIELRLHPYNGDSLYYNIHYNKIFNNGEDGIQLIDYPDLSDRIISIQRNLIYDNSMAGIGMMGDSNTVEDYSGAPIPEKIIIKHNTISGNNHGITGGTNALVKYNIVVNTIQLALKNIDSASVVNYTLLWNNGNDASNSNLQLENTFYQDPLLKENFTLMEFSPAIDKGDSSCLDPDNTLCDLGAFYFGQIELLRTFNESATQFNVSLERLSRETFRLQVPPSINKLMPTVFNIKGKNLGDIVKISKLNDSTFNLLIPVSYQSPIHFIMHGDNNYIINIQ